MPELAKAENRTRDFPLPDSEDRGGFLKELLCYIPRTFQGHFMAHDSDYKPGSMDISQHQRAYAGFLTFTKWSLGGILLIMILLAFFRTHG